jgi:hypothetical protein
MNVSLLREKHADAMQNTLWAKNSLEHIFVIVLG